jgi:hypothetical protein
MAANDTRQENSSPTHVCQGLTAKNAPCRQVIKEGETFCWRHKGVTKVERSPAELRYILGDDFRALGDNDGQLLAIGNLQQITAAVAQKVKDYAPSDNSDAIAIMGKLLKEGFAEVDDSYTLLLYCWAKKGAVAPPSPAVDNQALRQIPQQRRRRRAAPLGIRLSKATAERSRRISPGDRRAGRTGRESQRG